MDYATAEAIWALVEQGMGLDAEITAASSTGFHPTRAGTITMDGAAIGVIGELHPSVVRAFGLEGRVVAGEFSLAPLIEPHPYWEFEEPSSYPPIVFDLAFDLAEETPASALLETIRSAAGRNLEDLEVFDVFRGSPLGKDRKSLAVQLRFRSMTSTLRNEDVRDDRERIIAAVAERLGGRLRGGA